ncbi:hypothetical protein SAY87_014302 [Trapa incisa]|uniref:protein-serine/threonine phosphatase n=1 Tax=Trapa incisa TaxID=236973 RepID=A0AAN7GJR8_9MYRT|nr:hypothetical protein SAY87_014302 [Trapa incisa]
MPLKGFPDTGDCSSHYINHKCNLNCPSGSTRFMLENSPTLPQPYNSCFGKTMAPENNYLGAGAISEGSYKKENVTGEEKIGTLRGLKPPSSKIGRPPRHCASSVQLSAAAAAELELDVGLLSIKSASDEGETTPFIPIFRSGSCSEIGAKPFMEDEHICIDNLLEHLGSASELPSPGAFYGVFDGHGGSDAAVFVRENILRFIVEDAHLPICTKEAIRGAFLRADYAFADADSLDSSSGTTALTALILGRKMLVANAGDCRAVLSKRGKAIELSKDHKPDSVSERLRIESLGGVVYDGYLNGQLSVARALGDWHMKKKAGPGDSLLSSSCPLIAEPEVHEVILSEEDEFLIIGCDGLWDVMSSQCAVMIARRELAVHNDPCRCSKELVREALRRDAQDNLTVVTVCFAADPPPRIEVPRRFNFKRSISAEGLNLLQEVLDAK